MLDSISKAIALLSRQERQHAILMIIMIFLGACFEVLGVGAIFPIVNILSDQAQIPKTPFVGALYIKLGQPPIGRFIVGVLLGLVCVYIIKNTYLAFLAYWQGRFAYNKQAALSQRLFRHYLSQPYTFHLQRNTAELTRNMTQQVDQLIGLVVLPCLVLVSELLTVFALVFLLLNNNFVAGSLLMAAFCLASLLFYRLIQAKLAPWGAGGEFHSGQLLLHIQQGLGSVKDTILLGRQNFFLQHYIRHSNARAYYVGRLHFVSALPLLWLETLAVASLLGLVVTLLLQGQSFAIVVPTLGLFTAAAFRLMPSVNRILVAIQNLRFSKSIIDTLYRELNEFAPAEAEGEVVDDVYQAHLRFDKVIELRDVFFSYPGAAFPSLSGIALCVGKGESIGIVGPSGSGKTTLVDVILGLLQPTSGQILIDQVDIANNKRAWQEKIGYVPQNIYLTDDSVRNNIAFGMDQENICESQIWHALEIAHLAEYIQTLPDGLDTIVGERGVRLSGGQRQRIGIARAVYHNPEVLVFDEATSALDSETEAAVVAAIEGLRGQTTMIVIAHRLTTVANCDRVIKLEKGMLVV